MEMHEQCHPGLGKGTSMIQNFHKMVPKLHAVTAKCIQANISANSFHDYLRIRMIFEIKSLGNFSVHPLQLSHDCLFLLFPFFSSSSNELSCLLPPLSTFSHRTQASVSANPFLCNPKGKYSRSGKPSFIELDLYGTFPWMSRYFL